MDEPTLSKTDREIMTSRGWDTDNAASVAKYQELRGKVEAQRMPEKELNRQMNNFEMEQHIKGTGRSLNTGVKPPDIER